MLRRTIFLSKVTRSWTKKSISAATAHFPDAIHADPAASRSGSVSAKEQRNWTLNEGGSGMIPSTGRLPSFINRVTKFTSLYVNLVRFDRPVGWQLLLIPCYWGSGLAVTKALVWEGADPIALFAPFIPLHLAMQFLVGAYLMRSVGCIVNDMCDRKFDRMVERTATRPLASGEMSMVQASAVLVSHLSLAAIVALSLSPAALQACLAITPIWMTYPLMKRITYAPQLFLGLCFNWGVFVGYAAVLGRVDLAVCLPIYLAGVLHTILYDTIYAYQDRRDDLKCGVKSTAIWIGDRKYILTAMIAPIMLGMMVSGMAASQTLPFYVGIALCIWRLNTIVDDVNIYDSWSCAQGFKRNVRLGFYVFFAICVGNLLWAIASEHDQRKDVNTDTAARNTQMTNFLFFDQHVQQRLYNTESFSWVDRMVHPVFVQAEVARAEGATEPPPIPAWMRREYLGENVATIMALCGASETTVEAWTQWWYGFTDHYNMFSKVTI